MNIAAWIWAYLAFRDQPILLGTAFLAYTFGLRHALDADHIAAIDNVTRKLVQDGDRPAAEQVSIRDLANEKLREEVNFSRPFLSPFSAASEPHGVFPDLASD